MAKPLLLHMEVTLTVQGDNCQERVDADFGGLIIAISYGLIKGRPKRHYHALSSAGLKKPYDDAKLFDHL